MLINHDKNETHQGQSVAYETCHNYVYQRSRRLGTISHSHQKLRGLDIGVEVNTAPKHLLIQGLLLHRDDTIPGPGQENRLNVGSDCLGKKQRNHCQCNQVHLRPHLGCT